MLLNPYFGQYGGQFVPELLLPALDQLERAYVDAKDDPAFRTELDRLLTTYAGRPTPLTRLTRLTEGTKTTIYLKREDLLHGGAHKTNQVLGQALLTRPGAPHEAHGQDPRDRRDGRGPARRRHGARLGPIRLQVQDLHGRQGR